ncbi:MAG: DUF488 domain-containing protein [Thermomicrobiales bacterium]|nr:DUF488 domain-containing protein [Thermomicrobiales bacterium]MCO5219828.1 DUF488 domain-containing protein [Thermomicrobiales bacterium]MCO5224579.1 DUF488 domain-containing protein [Thermomicrobiales bacterium]MCO5227344.1 DUF488 domain-containing protein [Thermomicrobiales bacterium]
MHVFTIGVYGFDEGSFLKELTSNNIDAVIDIRRRRAVRGPHYAFANSQRLQENLADADIRYVHVIELSPPATMIQEQIKHDTEHGGKVHDRSDLPADFRATYHHHILDGFDFDGMFAANGITDGNICFLCVERTAAACHRGMVAERLHELYGWPVTNLEPS